jgi:S1-C subfamily serine protease
MQQITPNIAKAYDFPVNWGAYVTGVELNSPAGRSNLQSDNSITKIIYIAVEEHTFVNEMFAFQTGEPVTIKILRGNSAVRIQITLGETMSG